MILVIFMAFSLYFHLYVQCAQQMYNVMEADLPDKSVKPTARDYATVLDVSHNSAKETPMYEMIDSVLTRLDEFYGMMNMIRTDSTEMTDDVLHNFRAERDKLQLVYQKIDELERFVQIVKENCNTMEACLKESGSEYSVVNSLKKAILGIHIPFREARAQNSKPKRQSEAYSPPAVFKTADYFSP